MLGIFIAVGVTVRADQDPNISMVEIGRRTREFLVGNGLDGWTVLTVLAAVIIAYTVTVRSGLRSAETDPREFAGSGLLNAFLFALGAAAILTSWQIVLENLSGGSVLSSFVAVVVAFSLCALAIEARMVLHRRKESLGHYFDALRRVEFLRWSSALRSLRFYADPSKDGRLWSRRSAILGVVWYAVVMTASFLAGIGISVQTYSLSQVFSLSVAFTGTIGTLLVLLLDALRVAWVSKDRADQVMLIVVLVGVLGFAFMLSSLDKTKTVLSVFLATTLAIVFVFFLDWFWCGPIYRKSRSYCERMLERNRAPGRSGRLTRR